MYLPKKWYINKNGGMKMQKIRWGILSTASIARKHMISAINKSKNGEVYAVASRTYDKARTFADEMGIENAYGSYEELIADPNVDAIYNPLPVSLHAEWSIKCAEAGKPALCEKPLACNAEDAKRMVGAFRERGVLLGEGFMYRFHPLTRRVQEIIGSGKIGKLTALRSNFFIAVEDDNIRWQADMGGGALLDLGCYSVGIMRFLSGEDPIDAKGYAQWKIPGKVDESFVGMMVFPSGAMGYFGVGLNAGFDCSYEVFGSNGRILIDRGGMVVWPGEDFVIKCWSGDNYEEIKIPATDHYQMMLEDFGDALMEKREPAYPVEDGVKNMEVIDTLFSSAREHSING